MGRLRIFRSISETTPDREIAAGAIDALYWITWHQGTVYSASASAAPFLVEAIPSVSPEHQANIISLLAEMVQGHGYYEAHRHMPYIKEAMEKTWASEPELTLSHEQMVAQATTLAVFDQ